MSSSGRMPSCLRTNGQAEAGRKMIEVRMARHLIQSSTKKSFQNCFQESKNCQHLTQKHTLHQSLYPDLSVLQATCMLVRIEVTKSRPDHVQSVQTSNMEIFVCLPRTFGRYDTRTNLTSGRTIISGSPDPSTNIEQCSKSLSHSIILVRDSSLHYSPQYIGLYNPL